MKNCRHCDAMIPDQTHKCPHCRAAHPRGTWAFQIFLVGMVVAAAAAMLFLG